MSDDPDLEQLRQETDHGDRLDEAAGEVDTADLREDIIKYLAEIEGGDRQKTVSVWDGDLAALMAALEEHPDHLDAIGESLRSAVGVEGDGEIDRSEVLRLALRLGLREAAPEYMDTAREAIQENATRGL